MKNIIAIALACVALLGCEKEDEKVAISLTIYTDINHPVSGSISTSDGKVIKHFWDVQVTTLYELRTIPQEYYVLNFSAPGSSSTDFRIETHTYGGVLRKQAFFPSPQNGYLVLSKQLVP